MRACCYNAANSGVCLLHCNNKLQSVRACCCNAANSGACPAPELACCCNATSSGACPAPELACCNVASFGAFWLRSVRACCCNAASSGACPAPKFAATKPYNAASSGASLAVEEKEKEPWTFCPILNIFYFALV